MDYIQTELALGIAGIPAHNQEWRSPQYDPTWDEQLPSEKSTCEAVGERVTKETEDFIHQPEYTHFIERYWVEKKAQKYWYYRYTWKVGGKLQRKYIGSTSSARAKKIKQRIEGYIRDNLSPEEITTLMNAFSITIEEIL